jgi:hypothetical protein
VARQLDSPGEPIGALADLSGDSVGENAGPYGMTIALIANVLFVMNRVFGIPPSDAIIEAVNTA